MSTPGTYVTFPDPNDEAKIAGVIKEISHAMEIIALKRGFISDAKKALKEDYELTPKSITNMIKLYHNQNADAYFEEQEELQELFDRVFNKDEDDE